MSPNDDLSLVFDDSSDGSTEEHETVVLPVEIPAYAHMLQLARADYESIVEKAKRVDIASQAELEVVSESVLILQKIRARLEEERKATMAPLRAELDTIMGHFRDITDKIEALTDVLKKAVRKYLDDQAAERRARLEAERLRELERLKVSDAEKQKVDALFDALTPAQEKAPPVMKTASGTVSTRRVCRWKLIDIDTVPKKFKILDEKAINQVAKTCGSTLPTIPGIEFYWDTTIVA